MRRGHPHEIEREPFAGFHGERISVPTPVGAGDAWAAHPDAVGFRRAAKASEVGPAPVLGDAHDVGAVDAGRHEVEHAGAAAAGAVDRFEHERVVEIGALALGRFARRDAPVTQ